MSPTRPFAGKAHMMRLTAGSPETSVNWQGGPREFFRALCEVLPVPHGVKARSSDWSVSYIGQVRPARVRPRVNEIAGSCLVSMRLAPALRSGRRMKPAIAANTSPLNCRWIMPGSAHCVADWSYAICQRDVFAERLVNESDCAHCPRWEEPDDAARRLATLAWNRMSSPAKVEP